MEELCIKLKKEAIVKSEQVFKALTQVDRADFTDSSDCYMDWYA